MTEPKLLTEAEARNLWAQSHARDHFIELLRERGLLAEEPVDPLLIEAREIAAEWGNKFFPAGSYREGHWDDSCYVQIALAALRRGMELGRSDPVRPPLTVEVVREAMNKVWSDTGEQMTVTGFADLLHAALVEQMQ